jgi:hypothetical protein
MKVLFAKIFCFLTVLLMSSNIALSSIPEITGNSKIQLTKTTKEKLQFSDGLSIPIVSFVLEKDPYEESDFFEDVYFDFSFANVTFNTKAKSSDFYSYYFLSAAKIPLWLWVRSIKI